MGIRYKIKYEYRFAHHAAHFSRDVKPFAPIFGLCANNIDFLSSSSSTQSAARLTVQGNVCPDVDQVLFGARGSSDTHSVTPVKLGAAPPLLSPQSTWNAQVRCRPPPAK